MSISNIGQPGAAAPPKVPETVEPKGPDLKRDNDADDIGAPPAAAPASLPPGQGTIIDKKA